MAYYFETYCEKDKQKFDFSTGIIDIYLDLQKYLQMLKNNEMQLLYDIDKPIFSEQQHKFFNDFSQYLSIEEQKMIIQAVNKKTKILQLDIYVNPIVKNNKIITVPILQFQTENHSYKRTYEDSNALLTRQTGDKSEFVCPINNKHNLLILNIKEVI